jgi:hypothetical protein
MRAQRSESLHYWNRLIGIALVIFRDSITAFADGDYELARLHVRSS